MKDTINNYKKLILQVLTAHRATRENPCDDSQLMKAMGKLISPDKEAS